MIHSFEVLDPENVHIPWWAKVPALSKPRTFEFKPGLNIIWGQNGSGKTTVVKALARLFHCEQSGNPVVTTTSLGEMSDRWGFGSRDGVKVLPKSIVVKHDGQPVRSFDSSNVPGIISGGGAFDDDFLSAGIRNTMFKGSAGETTVFRFTSLIRDIVSNTCSPVVRKVTKDRVNDLWGVRVDVAEHFLKGSGKKGPLTILLDEPERSLDLPSQVTVWRYLRAYAPSVQFIVASHSLYALNIPEANYIEMTPGYLEKSKECIELLPAWHRESPVPKAPTPTTEEVTKERDKKKSRQTACKHCGKMTARYGGFCSRVCEKEGDHEV